MGKVIIEFDEDDVTRLFQTQESLLEVMLRIERLLKEKRKDDPRSKSKESIGAYRCCTCAARDGLLITC